MLSKSKFITLALLTVLTSQKILKQDDSKVVAINPTPDILVAQESNPILTTTLPTPEAKILPAPVEISPLPVPVDETPVIIKRPIIKPPIIYNPCVVDNCRCYNRDGMRTMIYEYCPEDRQNCLSKFGECKPNVEGICEFAPVFSNNLQKCLNNSNYCQKFGCGLETCQKDNGLQIKLRCLTVPTNRKCYEKATCEVNSQGTCAYRQTPDFEVCLLTDRLITGGVKPSNPKIILPVEQVVLNGGEQ